MQFRRKLPFTRCARRHWGTQETGHLYARVLFMYAYAYTMVPSDPFRVHWIKKNMNGTQLSTATVPAGSAARSGSAAVAEGQEMRREVRGGHL